MERALSRSTPEEAAYLALAEGLDCPFMTVDERLVRTPGSAARIINPG